MILESNYYLFLLFNFSIFFQFLDEGGSFEATASFRTGSEEEIIFLKRFAGWNPFPDDPTGINKWNSVIARAICNREIDKIFDQNS